LTRSGCCATRFRTIRRDPGGRRALNHFFDQHIAPELGRENRRSIELAAASLPVETLRIEAVSREHERAAAVRGNFAMMDP
jgi:hypothetical protein